MRITSDGNEHDTPFYRHVFCTYCSATTVATAAKIQRAGKSSDDFLSIENDDLAEEIPTVEECNLLFESIYNLAVKVHHFLSKDASNIVFSPLSIYTGIAALLYPAKGLTEDQMRAVLGLPIEEKMSHNFTPLYRYLSAVRGRSDNSCSCPLLTTDILICHRDLLMNSRYFAQLRMFYNIIPIEGDFSTESEDIISYIDSYVKLRMPENFLNPVQSCDPESVMVMLHLVSFRGQWLELFPPERTDLGTFHNNGNVENATQVHMMHTDGHFQMYNGETLEAVRILSTDEIAILIILPRAMDGLESVEASFTTSLLREILENLASKTVAISLPRFRLECTKSLEPCYRFLGTERILEAGAELCIATRSPDARVSEILHKAVLEVDENRDDSKSTGKKTPKTEKNKPLQIDQEFVVDHPFAFVVYHAKYGAPLLMGRVCNL